MSGRAGARVVDRRRVAQGVELDPSDLPETHAGETRAPAPEDARLISPDLATCADCLRELFDPNDRRYRYPFISCPNCGPRFAIALDQPYQRANTTMRSFAPCADCAREYDDPSDRRFHDEAVACPGCGPTLRLHDASWQAMPGDAIEPAAALLRAGKIVALSGPAGFALACDATNEAAISLLRRRASRPDEPFTVMVADERMALDLFDLSPAETARLVTPGAPVLLVGDQGKLGGSVAPSHRRQGVLLPHTPLHHLLLRATDRPLAMASSAAGNEPTCISDQEAKHRLSRVADAFLVHDRPALAPIEDSVLRLWGQAPVVLRRGRGLVPGAIALPAEVAPTLAMGADRHGAFCLAGGSRAFLSQPIGDLRLAASRAAFRKELDRYARLFGIEPEAIAHDLAPDGPGARLALESSLPTVPVQHHHAHVVAVMAEHRLEGRVMGVAFDGFGLGEDGTAWGGEFLVASWASAQRSAHLRAVRQPGGEAAAIHPVRMALAYAADAGVTKEARRLLGGDRRRGDALLAQIASGIDAPWSTSAGRLFDAVSALGGVCRKATYDEQPTILLEQAADSSATHEYPFELAEEAGKLVVDTRPIVAAVVRDLVKGSSAGEIAGRFHRTMAAVIMAVCRILRGWTGLDRVVLSGGVFQDALLASDAAARLQSCGFHVYTAAQAPVGDEGIALGQMLVAHARQGGT